MSALERATILFEKAAHIITGPRFEQHGGFLTTHENIAQLWNAYLWDRLDLRDPLTASDVATLMELLKIARRKSGNNNDEDYVDAAGYAAIAYAVILPKDETRDEDKS